MLSLLLTRNEIAQAQRDLQDTMSRVFLQTHRPDAQFPYHHNGKHWYRAGYLPGGNGTTARHFNGFGTVRDGLGPRATVEINVAEEGRRNAIFGFFARDMASGTVYLMHAGSIFPNGFAFRDWYGQKQYAAFDASPAPREGFIVIAVDGSTGDHALARYIESVAAFRRSNDEVPDDPAKYRPFFQEARGWRVSEGPGVVEYLSRHGDVVDALRIWREGHGLENPERHIVKNSYIDMGVVDTRDSLTELYEVKTSAGRSDVYTGIGQLMVHGRSGCRRILVLPGNEELKPGLPEAIKRLEIELLRYDLNKEDGGILEDEARGERGLTRAYRRKTGRAPQGTAPARTPP